jgi:hypothetical protein
MTGTRLLDVIHANHVVQQAKQLVAVADAIIEWPGSLLPGFGRCLTQPVSANRNQRQETICLFLK